MQGPLPSSGQSFLSVETETQPREQPSGFVPRASETESDVMTRLRDRLKNLEQRLKSTQGVVDVWRSKTERALEREGFLMEEIKRVAEGMQCIRLDPREEERRINSRLRALAETAARYGSDFWSNRDRSYAVAFLQDRASQVGVFATTCASALGRVHRTLFPLNPLPQGLSNLMAKFRHGKAAREFVREQLIGGVVVALAFIRIHYPGLDLDKVGDGPLPSDGGDQVMMDHHYAAVRGVAEDIIERVENETYRIVRERGEMSSD